MPLPLEPPVTVSQDVALLTAVHAQPAGAVTFADPFSADAPADTLDGETDTEQLRPDWVIVKVAPAMVIVPTRCDDDVLAATL